MFTRAYTKEQAVLKQSKAINKEFNAKAMIEIDEAYWSELEDNPGTLPRLPSRDGSSCCYIPQVFVPISQVQSLGTATCGQIGADGMHLLQGHT